MKREVMKQHRLRRRIKRVRKTIFGTPDRPRLTVFRSNRNIGAQIIDDLAGRTLCAASTEAKEIRGQSPHGGNCAAAKVVGKTLGEKAREMGIEQVCFDRRGRRYHGRVKALADAAREAGLKF